MALFTLGRAFASSLMAAFTIFMGSALEAFQFCFFIHTIMTGSACTNGLAIGIGYLFTSIVLTMMAIATCGTVKILMSGMVKGARFFSVRAKNHLSWAIVSHGGYAEAHEKS